MINIDFLICNYNTYNLLDNCLNSILNLKSNNLSINIFIYDNNSNDISLSILHKYEKHDFIHVIYGESNLGYGKAINFIFNISSADFIFILNPDTILDFNSEQLLNLCKSMKNYEISGFKILNPERTIQQHATFEPGLFWLFVSLLRKGYPFLMNHIHRLYFSIKSTKFKNENIFISGCALLMNRTVFKTLGGFNEIYFLYFEDTELLKNAKYNNYKISESDLTILHNASFSVKNSNIKIKTELYKSALLYYKTNFSRIKYYTSKQILFMASFLCLINPINLFFRKNTRYFFELISISFKF